MARTAIKARDQFAKDAAGEAQYNAPENWSDSDDVKTDNKPVGGKVVKGHNPPQVEKTDARLLGVSELITISRPDSEGTVNDISFRNLDLEDKDGNPLTRSVNEAFFDKIKSRLTVGKPYKFSFEVTKAGVTTYLDVDGKPVKHTRSNERLTTFQPISEAAFGGMDDEIERLTSKDAAYANAIASVLNSRRDVAAKLALGAK